MDSAFPEFKRRWRKTRRPSRARGRPPTRLLVVALILSSTSCSTVPIRDVSRARLPAGAEEASTADIDEAIWRAGRKLGWVVEREAPAELVATLRRRSHVAVVSIEHDGRRFDIRYRDSRNLDQRGGSIHENYNVWIRRLARRIQEEPIRLRDRAP